MIQFTYQARDLTGKICQGELSAETADEASLQLRQDGMYLLSLEEQTASSKGAGLALFKKRISRNDMIYLTSQMAIMIDAGVPLVSALESLATQAENPTMKEMLTDIQQNVEGGEDLSLALSRFPKQFDITYVNLVKASEASGTLAEMLDRIATQSRTELETRQQVRGALMYPAAMLVMCIGVSIFLLTYVFPKLTPMFETRSIDIPKPTLFMMALSGALTHHWYWFIIGLVAVVGGLIYMRRQSWGRRAFDWFWMHLPILGPMLKKVAISRSLRTLATTINSGVPMLESLRLCAGVSNNVFFEECWLDVSDKVTTGKQIHEALQGNKLFPQTLLQMIASGESTGKLGQVLNKVSDYFEREVSNAVKTATSMVEPVMVVVMGSVIGTIALAMLLPIFKLSSHTG